MAWTAPKLDEIPCGMEINMYFPADDQDELSEALTFAAICCMS